MNGVFTHLLGLNKTVSTLTYSQIMWRTFSVFTVALVLLRISGRRTLASNSALELIVKIMTGAILSRAIMGDAPYLLTLVAATSLVLMHRVLAYLTYFFPFLGRFLRGSPSVLAEGTTVFQAELRRASLTEADMLSLVRSVANLEDLSKVTLVRLEPDGLVSVIKKDPKE